MDYSQWILGLYLGKLQGYFGSKISTFASNNATRHTVPIIAADAMIDSEPLASLLPA
jgi:hypothetical protein